MLAICVDYRNESRDLNEAAKSSPASSPLSCLNVNAFLTLVLSPPQHHHNNNLQHKDTITCTAPSNENHSWTPTTPAPTSPKLPTTKQKQIKPKSNQNHTHYPTDHNTSFPEKKKFLFLSLNMSVHIARDHNNKKWKKKWKALMIRVCVV